MTRAIFTGPITGEVTTAEGTNYDVSAPIIEVPEEDGDEVADLIGQRYATEGHPAHPEGEPPFEYIPPEAKDD